MGEKQKPVAEESQIQIRKQLSYAEIEQIGKAFVASKMFGDDMDRTSMAITKIMAGQELGLAPFASMRAVHVIEGNATLSANTMAGMVKSSGRYDYYIKKKELDGCVIDFYEIRSGKRTKIGTETFDIDEARMAGMFDSECEEAPLKHNIRKITMYKKGGGSWQKDGCNCKANWKNYPKAMMFARAISNGVRTYCPDVFSGMLVYTPDELNAQVRADGTVIDVDPATGEVTNMPEQKKSAEAEKKEEAAVDTDPNNEGTEDHPDVTSPDEPSQDEIEAASGVPHDPSEQPGSEEVGAQEPEEVEQPPVVDQEFKDTAWQMYESLPLKSAYRLRWLKDVTGSITRNSIKTDEKWRALMDRAGAVLSGDEEIDADQRTDTGDQEKIV